jgi:hypothetical protein
MFGSPFVAIFQQVFLRRIHYKDSLVLIIYYPPQKKNNIFWSKRVEAIGSWPRQLHGEKVQHLYPSPNIITMIKSRRIQVDKMGQASGTCGK